jgi:hypothetical protein
LFEISLTINQSARKTTMGRFETLNADTRDLVNCLLPALAASFGISDPVDIIPEDIRMRAWDCERRDHIKDQTENDPRNWGVQFLKDLMAISRLKKGDLDLFQTDLRAKVVAHEEKHPWCRLSDIKELKDHYEHPNRPKLVEPESSGTSSTDSYLEELHEPDLPPGMKRGRRLEVYEARVQPSHKRRKCNSSLPLCGLSCLTLPDGRLRRSGGGGFERKEKIKGRSKARDSNERSTPGGARPSIRRSSKIVESDGEDSYDLARAMTFHPPPTPSFSRSPAPPRATSLIAESVDTSTQPLHVQKMQAELEVAEAELKAARLKYAYTQAKEQAENEAKYGNSGSPDMPQNFD